MTPYEKADKILESLICLAGDSGVEMPSVRYAVLGEPVVSCASVIVTLTSINTPPEVPACNAPQVGTFSVIISRDCANISAPNGDTIPEEAVKVADTQSTDGQLLWDLVVDMHGAMYPPSAWSIGFVVTGGLAITSMMMTANID